MQGFQRAHTERGFTLIELMLTLMIAAVGVALAVPTVENITQRRHATAKAEHLASLMAQIRSLAVKNNTVISVRLMYTGPDNWCVGADDSANGCDCTVANACTIGTTEYRMDNTEMPKSKMTQHTADTLFVFDPVRGIMREGDLAYHSYVIRSDNDNFELQVGVSPTGRVLVCNSDATKQVNGFKSCSTAAVPLISP